MNRLTIRLAAATALTVSLSACGGSSGSAPIAPIVTATSSTTAPPLSTAGAVAVPYGAALLSGASYVGAVSLKDMGVDLNVKMRDAAGLQKYAVDASNPKSPTYRHWLTPQEIGDRFGADATAYKNTVAALNAQHLAVKTYPQREMVRVRGAQADLERVLGTTFGLYRKGMQVFVAPSTAPRPALALNVSSIRNAVSYTRRHRNSVPVRASSAYIQGYSPQQIANAFDFSGAYSAGFKGDGISIGIIGTGPITDGDPRINVGDVQDIRKLYSIGGTGTVNQIYDLTNVSPGTGQQGSSYSTGLASPPPVTSPAAAGCVAQNYSPGDSTSNISDYTTCNPEDVEAQLDTEQAATLAPNATVNFYIAYNPMECNGTCGNTAALPPAQEIGLPESDDEIQQAIADNKSDIISMSFGSDELDNDGTYYGSGSNNFGPTEIASLVAEGIAVFVSSGDAGAQGCAGTNNSAIDPDALCVSYPATDPSAVSVGGVNAPLSDSGQLTGPLTGWGEQTQNPTLTASGSGGGCSIFFQGPTYEQSPFLQVSPSATLCNGNRTQPDMSMDGDTNTGVAVVTDADPTLGGRAIYAVGGTSVAAPEMAAMWALVLEACKNTAKCDSEGSGSTPWRLGNPNPLLFPLLNPSNSSAYAASFYDVQFGNNSLINSSGTGQDAGYNAGVGYDLVTGLGVPYGANLIKYVVGV